MDVAYFDQQCLLNPQYDDKCPGYVAPVDVTDPIAIDDGKGTGDSIVDNVLGLPGLTIAVVKLHLQLKLQKLSRKKREVMEVVIQETVEEAVVEDKQSKGDGRSQG